MQCALLFLPVCSLFSTLAVTMAVNYLLYLSVFPFWGRSRVGHQEGMVVMGTKGTHFPSLSSNCEEMTHTCDIFRYLNGPSAQIGRRGRRRKNLSTLTLRASLAPLSLQTAVSRQIELWACPCAHACVAEHTLHVCLYGQGPRACTCL